MKKILIVISLLAVMFAYALTAEAWTWYADYIYSQDDSVVYDRYSWGGWNHLAVTWNDSVLTVSAIQMDPDGIPNLYYWGDIYSGYYPYATTMYLYYSYNGSNWYYAGVYYYY